MIRFLTISQPKNLKFLIRQMTNGSLTLDFIKQSNQRFEADPKNIFARNAVTNTTWGDVVINREEFQSINHVFSVKLNDMKITSQKQSGRCWLFAGLNVMRRAMAKKYNLPDDFELSQSFLFFYDKLEKCNYLLENIIDTHELDVDSRLIQHLLTDPTNDGGQWDMLVSIVKKYGVVPKNVYPDSITSCRSVPLNYLLVRVLHEHAETLRNSLRVEKKTMEEVRALKNKMMEEIYGIMVIHLGTPPTNFNWSVMDKDKKVLGPFKNLTPTSFYDLHVPVDVTQFVSIVNDPRNEYNTSLSVDRLGNVWEGPNMFYINTSIEDLVAYAKQTLDNGEPVWFGCEVSKDSSMKKTGIMSTKIFDYNLAFNIQMKQSKKQRLIYHESLMTHAMVFTGYHLEDENDTRPSKWRVENSWGDDRGDKGYDIMTADWFDEHMYQIVVDKKILKPEHLKILEEKKPKILPAWDPMGSLA